MDVWAATNVGRVRKDNEDALLVDEALGLFVVADGMGGHAAGEVASQLAVETVREHLLASRDKIEAFARATGEVRRTDILRLLEASVLAACGKVHSEADKDSSKRGMGTTLDVLLVAGNRGFVAHVGDSRI
ncbi:MAG: serine/threonine-protein phosphatase, partial [Myxococcales bacterium]|nr:serine/threonine-protein phosphatase [Myxococcales bacterium]